MSMTRRRPCFEHGKASSPFIDTERPSICRNAEYITRQSVCTNAEYITRQRGRVFADITRQRGRVQECRVHNQAER